MEKVCIVCENSFEVSKYARKDSKCCSNACNTKWWYRNNKQHVYEYNKKYLAVPEKRELHNKAKRTYERRTRLKLRLEVLRKYGDKCVKCGLTDYRVLQIDHIYGGGNQETKIKFGRRTHKYYGHLLKDESSNYQILCANCNQIKKYEEYENGNDKRRH